MKRFSHLATVAAAASILALAQGPAYADGPNGQERDELREEVSTTVWTAGDPQAVVDSFSATERELVEEAINNMTAKTAVSEFELLEPEDEHVQAMGEEAVELARIGQERAEPGSAAAQQAQAAACYRHYQYHEWYDLGFHTGDTWMELNWCHNGSRVTSHSVSQAGGVGYKGNEYQGVNRYYTRDVGWEIRKAGQFNFNFFGASAQPCTQIRGGDGLYSARKGCNLS